MDNMVQINSDADLAIDLADKILTVELDKATKNHYIRNLTPLLSDSYAPGKVPFFKASKKFINFAFPYLYNKYVKILPELDGQYRKDNEIYGVSDEMVFNLLYHLYVSSKIHRKKAYLQLGLEDPEESHGEFSVEGYSIAYCKAFLRKLNKGAAWLVSNCIKTNKYFCYRLNNQRDGVCERYLINSSFFQFMDTLVASFNYINLDSKIEKKVTNNPKDFYKDEYIKENEEIDLSEVYKDFVKEDNLEKYFSEFEISIDKTPFATHHKRNEKLPRAIIPNYIHHKKSTHSYSKYGRVSSKDNKQNIKSCDKKYLYDTLFPNGYVNYDIESSQLNIAIEILKSYRAFLRKSKASDIKIAESDFAISSIQNFISIGKESIARDLNIPVKLMKTVLYTKLFMGKPTNRHSSVYQDLYNYFFGNELKLKFCLNQIDCLPLMKSLNYLHSHIEEYHRFKVKYSKDKFLNGVTDYTKLNSERRKHLITYYSQGYEAYFINEVIRLCHENGIEVYSNEFDGVVTNKVIPKELLDKVKTITNLKLNLRIKDL